MGCISSKQAVSAESPAFELPVRADNGSLILDPSLKPPSGLGESEEKKKKKKKEEAEDRGSESGKSAKGSSNGRFSLSFKFGSNVHRVVEAEKTAAGWPGWLTAVAGEAIHGWVPLRADSFEKLEKIGQGTYSSVFKARDVGTGKIVALKKVRFDNFQPESIRFMAREIMVLRRLDHPNIMKLEGIITSRLSCSIYLVFEYMEHDLSGLISNPDIKFSDAQIKCYMQQLLYGLEHCHVRGIMHRDIKTSNILINNQGMLKVADFGLANFLNSRHKQQLTSRVVTLWYRPPELLLGSTNYGVSVDLWSVGCVFAEVLIGKPLLKGRTEVEQLHKIFKLCGSPPEEFWKKSKLPHATIFKPQHPYESSLRERCKEFPTTAVNLIETFLSIDTHNRGTASSALMSEYFSTKPFACEPSSLPKYAPSKEIDAKSRDDSRRKRAGVRTRGPGASRKPRRALKAFQEANDLSKGEASSSTHFGHGNKGSNAQFPKRKGGAAFGMPLDTVSEVSEMTTSSQGNVSISGQSQITPSSNLAWAKRQNLDAMSTISYGSTRSVLDQPSYARHTIASKKQEREDVSHGFRTNSRGLDSYKIDKRAMQNRQTRFGRQGSIDASDGCHSEELSAEAFALGYNLGYEDQREKVDHSGQLSSQSHRIDELLQKHESHIRQAVRKSRLQKET